MITHKNSMTPLAKRRKAVAEAVRRASLVSVCGKTWQEQFEKTLGLAGYKIARMTAFQIHQLRQNSVTADMADAHALPVGAVAGDRRCDPGATSAATSLRMRGDGVRDSRDGARKGNSRRTADTSPELRQRAAEDGSALQAAGDSANH